MAHNQSRIKIAIVDDHKLVRDGIEKLIKADTEDRFHILFGAANGEELANRLDKKMLPDVVIMDIEMPGKNGYQTVEWLKTFYPDIKILVVTMVDNEESYYRMFSMGVNGYLTKDVEPRELHAAINDIVSKGHYFTDKITGLFIKRAKEGNNAKYASAQGNSLGVLPQISQRQREFLELACTDKTYAEIADKMNLSPKTIDTYRETLFELFDVRNRMGLMIYAIKHNLVKL